MADGKSCFCIGRAKKEEGKRGGTLHILIVWFKFHWNESNCWNWNHPSLIPVDCKANCGCHGNVRRSPVNLEWSLLINNSVATLHSLQHLSLGIRRTIHPANSGVKIDWTTATAAATTTTTKIHCHQSASAFSQHQSESDVPCLPMLFFHLNQLFNWCMIRLFYRVRYYKSKENCRLASSFRNQSWSQSTLNQNAHWNICIESINDSTIHFPSLLSRNVMLRTPCYILQSIEGEEGQKWKITSTWCADSGTRSWLGRRSSSAVWPEPRVRPTPDIFACGSASPARRPQDSKSISSKSSLII